MGSDTLGTLGLFRDDDAVCVAPFEAVTVCLADLWTPA
jgi:hypothetical protein